MTDYKSIYAKAFLVGTYNRHPPNEPRFCFARDVIRMHNARTVVDVGSGRGDFLRSLPEKIDVTSVDLDRFHDVSCRFVHADLTCLGPSGLGLSADVLTCLDMLEHVGEDLLDKVLKELERVAPVAVITVSNHSDIVAGMELHSIQEPAEWWYNKLSMHYFVEKSFLFSAKSYFFELARKS